MIGMLFLIGTGVLVGGVDCVDRKNDRLWFLAQAMGGPLVLAVDQINQAVVQSPQRDWRRDQQLRQDFLAGEPSVLDELRRFGLGRVNEMGTLFVALAGLMNLVVILDAVFAAPPDA